MRIASRSCPPRTPGCIPLSRLRVSEPRSYRCRMPARTGRLIILAKSNPPVTTVELPFLDAVSRDYSASVSSSSVSRRTQTARSSRSPVRRRSKVDGCFPKSLSSKSAWSPQIFTVCQPFAHVREGRDRDVARTCVVLREVETCARSELSVATARDVDAFPLIFDGNEANNDSEKWAE